MNVEFNPTFNNKLLKKNPQSTVVGKKIIRESIAMISKNGYEQFTFQKLAARIETTEPTIYRYFSNKDKLLIYLVSLYWSYLEFRVIIQLNNIINPVDKLKKIIAILTWEDDFEINIEALDYQQLNQIVIAEGNKMIVPKSIDQEIQGMMYASFTDLSVRIARTLLELNPTYPYNNNLASSIINLAHFQYFFLQNLPDSADLTKNKNPKKTIRTFLEELVFKTLGVKAFIKTEIKTEERES